MTSSNPEERIDLLAEGYYAIEQYAPADRATMAYAYVVQCIVKGYLRDDLLVVVEGLNRAIEAGLKEHGIDY